MIYLDNAAESLPKPPQVLAAVAKALKTFGNPGRSACTPAMEAAREMLLARQAVARLVGVADPMRVGFTSGCTESMMLLTRMVKPGEPVLVTEAEHNSVLRPLHLAGARLLVLPCDSQGVLCLDQLHKMAAPGIRFAFVSHGSNVTGNVTDVAAVRSFCQERGITLVLDVAQTLGAIPVTWSMADVLCFTGHKALLGPQGTGGLVTGGGIPLPVLKTGGTGSRSFEPLQGAQMPDAVEAGTPNAHGLAGLRAGVEHVLSLGVDAIQKKEQTLSRRFVEALFTIKNLRLYGDVKSALRLPVVSFAIEGMDSGQVATRLWEEQGIATRAGSHCAPLLHQRLGTAGEGLVRCSFSMTNTPEEVDQAAKAIAALAREGC